jgi:hypothetical protein
LHPGNYLFYRVFFGGFMNKIILWTSAFLILSGLSFAKITFVMLPMSNEGASKSQLEGAFNSFYGNLINSKKFNIVDRERLKSILEENKMELSGLVENKNDIVKIGKLLGADKLISSKIYMKSADQIAVFFQVIDVKTAQVEMSKEIYYENYGAESDGRYCAAEIAAKYPLLGEVLGKAGDNVIINLGDNDGIAVGDRIFAARYEVMRGDNNEVLYEESKRIGILRVTGLMGGRSKTTVEKLADPKNTVQKGDIISPEPVPPKDTVIAKSPQMPDVKKGALVLDDDMQKKQYLTAVYNSGNSYDNGKLNLCATNITSGHVYAYYPLPFNNLQNFIMEGDVDFKKITADFNRIEVVFRCNGNYLQETAYSFFWQNHGEFSVYMSSMGQIFKLVPLQSSPAINRGEGSNHFKIVALGSRFDLYLNDQFIVGFEDERLEKGYVGFECGADGFVNIDNVKIWEISQ